MVLRSEIRTSTPNSHLYLSGRIRLSIAASLQGVWAGSRYAIVCYRDAAEAEVVLPLMDSLVVSAMTVYQTKQLPPVAHWVAFFGCRMHTGAHLHPQQRVPPAAG